MIPTWHLEQLLTATESCYNIPTLNNSNLMEPCTKKQKTHNIQNTTGD